MSNSSASLKGILPDNAFYSSSLLRSFAVITGGGFGKFDAEMSILYMSSYLTMLIVPVSGALGSLDSELPIYV